MVCELYLNFFFKEKVIRPKGEKWCRKAPYVTEGGAAVCSNCMDSRAGRTQLKSSLYD